MSEQLDRQKILARLRDLVKEKQTGTFFAITTDKHAVMIVFDNGAITSLSYANIRGLKALEKIVRLDTISCSFQDAIMGDPQPDIPSTREILAQWEDRFMGREYSGVSDFPWESTVKGISVIMSRYIGPIAPVLAKNSASRITKKNSEGITELIGMLAVDIMDGSDQQLFVSECKALLKKAG